MSDCIFVRLSQGRFLASKVYEDEQILAFLDISQVTPGHTFGRTQRTLSQSFRNGCCQRQPTLCSGTNSGSKVMKATKAAGMNIIANCEEVAGQTVFHTHVHLVPRYGAEDDLKIDFIAHEPDFDKLAQVAETIRNA